MAQAALADGPSAPASMVAEATGAAASRSTDPDMGGLRRPAATAARDAAPLGVPSN
ncbi:hypothetical protein [Roseicella aquatilis]|uniref:hypothetical protein n=1 Tax=Roseicella aquatilis TaxID=2527868 RepID=UPI001404DFFD|nr:hypothetical protein [Roseicella aquatilis]